MPLERKPAMSFHLRDGLLFTRHPDGGMTIEWHGHALTVPEGEWESVVRDTAQKADADLRRCAICGFVVDVSKAAEAPTIEWSTAGRSRPGLRNDPEDTNRAGGTHNPVGERLR